MEIVATPMLSQYPTLDPTVVTLVCVMRHAQTAVRLTCRILKEANSEAETLAPVRHPVLYQRCILRGLQDLLHSFLSTELMISQVQWLGVVHWTWKELPI
jgi:hypothetical protein